jgi:hypothetical protein
MATSKDSFARQAYLNGLKDENFKAAVKLLECKTLQDVD